MNFTLGVYLYIASIYCQDIKFIVGKWIQMKQLGGSIGVYSVFLPSSFSSPPLLINTICSIDIAPFSLYIPIIRPWLAHCVLID